MIAKTRAQFPFKFLAHNYCFQESGWLLFPGSSPDYWTHEFPAKAFHENVNMTSYYVEDDMVF